MIETKQTAPDFTLSRDGGGDVTLSRLRPKMVILYFYPRDDTPGCTIEAQDFSALSSEFDASNTVVIGISKDDIDSHNAFRDKYDLNVILLADTTGKICGDYGVWVEKINFGKKYMGIERTSVLIDENGDVVKIWRKVRVAGHADKVLETVQQN